MRSSCRRPGHRPPLVAVSSWGVWPAVPGSGRSGLIPAPGTAGHTPSVPAHRRRLTLHSGPCPPCIPSVRPRACARGAALRLPRSVWWSGRVDVSRALWVHDVLISAGWFTSASHDPLTWARAEGSGELGGSVNRSCVPVGGTGGSWYETAPPRAVSYQGPTKVAPRPPGADGVRPRLGCPVRHGRASSGSRFGVRVRFRGVTGGIVGAESWLRRGRYTLRTTEQGRAATPMVRPRNDGGPAVVTHGPADVRASPAPRTARSSRPTRPI
ncbi:hypothetical protein DER29_3162 [Micromonospora sp. M71_S20]|nr:hypothetical protein DER29_3162 [Micromonospora sp. M71_S20]